MADRKLILLALLVGSYLAFAPRGAEGEETSPPSDVLFEFDRADLTEEGREALAETAAHVAEEAEGGTVTVHGHTDGVGGEDYNLRLSEQRARTVAAALEELTGDADITFDTVGHGAAEPVAPERIGGWDNPRGREQNRRVEVEVGG